MIFSFRFFSILNLDKGVPLFFPNIPDIEPRAAYSAYSAISAFVSILNIGHGLNPELVGEGGGGNSMQEKLTLGNKANLH